MSDENDKYVKLVSLEGNEVSLQFNRTIRFKEYLSPSFEQKNLTPQLL